MQRPRATRLQLTTPAVFRVGPVTAGADYRVTDAHLQDLASDGIRGSIAAAIAQADDPTAASRLYREYLQGQYVLAEEAAVLTVATAGTGADIGTTLATYRGMRRYDTMTQARAALLATTPDPRAAYDIYRAFTARGIDGDAAALLAQSRNSSIAGDAYPGIMASGGFTATEAAMIASAGASANADSATIVEAARASHGHAILAAAALASGKSPAQLEAASAHFSDGDLAAAAWAVRDGHIMAAIVSQRFMQQAV